MFTIDDTIALPAPRGANADQVDTCPQCYPNVRNFGALFMVVAKLPNHDSIHMLLTPTGGMLAQAYKSDSTILTSDFPKVKLSWAYELLDECRARAESKLSITALPSVVAQRVRVALGGLSPTAVTMHCFTEASLRPAS